MKLRYFVLSVFLSVLFAGSAPAEVKITKITTEGKRAVVQFTYQNDSGNIHSIVKIECGIRGTDSKRDKGIFYISSHFSGGIKPGDSRSGSVKVNLRAAKAADIKCEDIHRPLVLK